MDNQTLGMKAEGTAYEKLRDALAMVESSGNPAAVQRYTNAQGLYQFIPRYWDKFFKDNTGRNLASFMPKDNSPAEMQRAKTEQQNILFPAYYEKELAPFVAATRRAGRAKNLTDIEIATAFHKLGSAAATAYFKTGKDASAGTKDNEDIASYIAKVDKNIGRAMPDVTSGKMAAAAIAYAKKPEETIATASTGGQAYAQASQPGSAESENQRVLNGLNDLLRNIKA